MRVSEVRRLLFALPCQGVLSAFRMVRNVRFRDLIRLNGYCPALEQV